MLLSGSVFIIFGFSITVFILFIIFDVLHHLLTDGSKHLGHVTDIMISIHHHHGSRHRLVMMNQPVLVEIMQLSHIVLTDQVFLSSASLLDPLQGNFWRCLETSLIRQQHGSQQNKFYLQIHDEIYGKIDLRTVDHVVKPLGQHLILRLRHLA